MSVVSKSVESFRAVSAIRRIKLDKTIIGRYIEVMDGGRLVSACSNSDSEPAQSELRIGIYRMFSYGYHV
jgi:hypothetical protein